MWDLNIGDFELTRAGVKLSEEVSQFQIRLRLHIEVDVRLLERRDRQDQVFDRQDQVIS